MDDMKSDKGGAEVDVVCRSGYKANERPLFFILANKRVNISEILDRWYGQECDHFKALADDGRAYILTWNRLKDIWCLEKIVKSADHH